MNEHASNTSFNRMVPAGKETLSDHTQTSVPSCCRGAWAALQGRGTTGPSQSPLGAKKPDKSPLLHWGDAGFRHWGSCISPALWLHSSSIFNHDIGVYFSILPANAVLTEKMLLSAILHDNPHLWWTGSLQRTTVRQVITSGTRCFPENLK